MSDMAKSRFLFAKKIWSVLRSIMRGDEEDYTTGSIGRAVLYLAIPMVLEMALESVFAVVDVFFVARLGADAVAAVGITDAIVTIVFAIGIGLSMGTTAMVARRIGEKDRHAASRAAVQAIWLGVFISAPVALGGIIFAEDILRIMGGSDSVVEIGSGFTAVLLGGNITIMLLFILNAVFRGAGDAVIAMRVLWISNILNIILDPLLIFGIGSFEGFGVTGAAIATTIGRGIGVVIQLRTLFSGRSRIPIALADLKPDWPLMRRLVRISIWGVFQFMISTSSWVVLVRILAVFGSAALAGYTIAIRIIIFTILPSWGLSNAAATLVGQNLGAKNPRRAEKSVWIAAYVNLAFLLSIAAVFIAIPEWIVRIFTDDPAVLQQGVEALRVISYGYGFYAFGMVIVQAFNGAGDTTTPTIVNFFSYWIFQIPLAYVFSVSLGFGAHGVYWAIPVAEALLTVIAVIVFKRGKWKLKEV